MWSYFIRRHEWVRIACEHFRGALEDVGRHHPGEEVIKNRGERVQVATHAGPFALNLFERGIVELNTPGG
jgi:hypothetical protein